LSSLIDARPGRPSHPLSWRNISRLLTYPLIRLVVSNQRSTRSIDLIDSGVLDDGEDITIRKHSFIEQVNNKLCYFGKLSSFVKYNLFHAYCTSYYGWSLSNSNIRVLCCLAVELNFDNAKLCLFREFNALYRKIGWLASEKVVLGLIRAKCLPINTVICVCVRYSRITEVHLNSLWLIHSCMKLLRTSSPAVVTCCQLAFNFYPVHSQLDIRTANFLQTLIAYANSLCYLFSYGLLVFN